MRKPRLDLGIKQPSTCLITCSKLHIIPEYNSAWEAVLLAKFIFLTNTVLGQNICQITENWLSVHSLTCTDWKTWLFSSLLLITSYDFIILWRFVLLQNVGTLNETTEIVEENTDNFKVDAKPSSQFTDMMRTLVQ